MGRKEVYRGGKESYRSDKRQEYTGDDGACPDCGCFACACSNSATFDDGSPTFASLSLREPCPSQTPDGDSSCIPLQLQITFPALTPAPFTLPKIGGGSVTFTPSAIPAISVCLTAVRMFGIGAQPFWVGTVTRGFKVTTSDGRCLCGRLSLNAFVAKSQAVTGGSGVSLFVREYLLLNDGLDIFTDPPEAGCIVGFSSETDLTPDDNFICDSDTTIVSDTTSDYLLPPHAFGYTSTDPAEVRACATCAAVPAEAGNCTASSTSGDCANVDNPPPPTPHCFYLLTAHMTGGTADAPVWSDWEWDADDPDATIIADAPPPPFNTLTPTVYRDKSGTCVAAIWLDGGPAATDGSDCPGPDEDDYPDPLSSSTKCPAVDNVLPCEGCSECTVWEYDRDPANDIFGPSNAGTTTNCMTAAAGIASTYGVSPLSECDTGWLDNGDGYYARFLVRCTALGPPPAAPSYP